MSKEEESDDVDIDLENIDKNNSDKVEFEKETKNYPVLGQDNNQFILEKKNKGFFSFFKHDKEKKVDFKTEDIVKEEPKHEEPKNDKFFITEEPKKTDEFILENFEGVYYNDSQRFTKKKVMFYGAITLAVIVGILFLAGIGLLIASYISSLQVGPCPYECCLNSTYDDKFCSGYATCEDNSCVKQECPDNYQCCSGSIYQKKDCEDTTLVCDSTFTCVKDDCPYACCTEIDNYAPKECANGGNCVNNNCFLQPCPDECCIDEIDYDDKFCNANEVCVENSCKLKLVENTKNFFNFIFTLYDTII